MPTTATTTTRALACGPRLGDSAGSIPAACIAGYLFATDKTHVKQTDLCARANNVSYEALDDEGWVSLKNMVLCMFLANRNTDGNGAGADGAAA